MYSLQNSSDANFGILPSEPIEDDFIANLFSQHVASDYQTQCPKTVIQRNKANHNVCPAKTFQNIPKQMHHDNAYTESSSILSPAWKETTSNKNPASSLNMSTYFSTFDPFIQLPLQHYLKNQAQNRVENVEKKHQALVPTAARSTRAVVKRKRKRTIFRTEQIEAMEEVFAKKPYITREDRMVLVKKLQISDKSIKVWFQNRRLKNKRTDEESFDDEDIRSPTTRLDYVESEIVRRTDEFGYVTLDDKLTSHLIQVIDDCLCNTVNETSNGSIDTETVDEPMEGTKVLVQSIPFYEPISPASTTDCSYDSNSWECQPEQNDSLQRLIDIESIIVQQ